MMDRKFMKLFLVSAAVLLLAACSKEDSDKKSATNDSKDAVHYGMEAKTDSYESLEELEDEATIIVKGVKLDKEDPVIEKSGEIVLSAYTFSEFEVQEVYKNAASKISEGDVITILENETYDQEANIVYHVAGYNRMVEGKEYLLFLRENQLVDKTYYVSLGVNFGTVSLEEDGRTTVYRTQEGNPLVSFEAYEDIWSQAKEKYQ